MEITVQGDNGQGETGPYSEDDQILLDQDAQDQGEEVGEQEETPQSYEEYAGEFLDIAPQLDEMGYQIHEEHPGEGWEEVSPEELEAIRRGEQYEESEEEVEDPNYVPDVPLSDGDQEAVVETIGGIENLDQVRDWAVNTLDQNELTAYNREVNSGDFTRARNAVQSMFFAWQNAMGSEPDLLGGSLGSSGDVFRSVQEVEAAMNDPRYLHDTAYTQDVEDKVSRSDVLAPR
jgi:hypothetical protein